MHVVAPASSANLGPGFDALGLALDLPFEFCVGTQPEGWLSAEPTHPASVAFRAAGGSPDSSVWWRSPIPPGRGLGFSGAARVAGAFAAELLNGCSDAGAQRNALSIAARLEGHPDNAAASALGGFVVAVGSDAVSVPFPDEPVVVAWWPSSSTSTDASRRKLPAQVDFADAVFSAGRAALWVAGVATGDLSVLASATDDRLHQRSRVVPGTGTATVLSAWRSAPMESGKCLGAWLSGSGPTVAALAPNFEAAEQLAAIATDAIQSASGAGESADVGHSRVLGIDRLGARRVPLGK